MISMLRFLSLILMLKCKQVPYLTSNHFFFIKHVFDKVLKVAVSEINYFARRKFWRNLSHKKNFGLV